MFKEIIEGIISISEVLSTLNYAIYDDTSYETHPLHDYPNDAQIMTEDAKRKAHLEALALRDIKNEKDPLIKQEMINRYYGYNVTDFSDLKNK